MMKVTMLTINSKIYLVAITLFSVSFLSAAAQTPITVTTDKTSYADGDTIAISGAVTTQLNIPISIVIRDSSQNMVYIAQTNPNSDGTYSTQAVAGGNTWKTPGTYEVDVTYGGSDKTANFRCIKSNQFYNTCSPRIWFASGTDIFHSHLGINNIIRQGKTCF
jgi:hypothetical protein